MPPRRCRASTGISRDVAAVAVIVATALAVNVVALVGVPLDSDITPAFRLQASTLPGIAEATPYGLRAVGATPDGLWEACRTYYQFFARWNCFERWQGAAFAGVAGGNGDAWRLMYAAVNCAALVFWYAIGRRFAVPGLALVLLALGLALRPLDVWTGQNAAESKGLVFFLAALWLACRRADVRTGWYTASLMVAAVLTKESYLAVWVAVAVMSAGSFLEDRPRAGRSDWRAAAWGLARTVALPHGVALAAVGVFAVGMRLAYPPLFDYGGGLPDRLALTTFVRTYLLTLTPALLRLAPGGMLLAAVVAAAVTVLLLGRRRSGACAPPVPWLLVAAVVGLAAALVLHGAAYYLIHRPVLDMRYALPANCLAALLMGLLVARCRAALAPRWRTVVGVGALVVAACWAVYAGPGDVVPTLALTGGALAALGVGALCLAWRSRPGQTLAHAAAAASVAVLLVAPVDVSLQFAGDLRATQTHWQAYLDRITREAPPHGHVLLRVAEPFMIEHVWATEAHTLLAGRTDLTYHVTVEDHAPVSRGREIDRMVLHMYEILAVGRAPLPPDPDRRLSVRVARVMDPFPGPPDLDATTALRHLVVSPSEFYRVRYLDGRNGSFAYEIGPPGAGTPSQPSPPCCGPRRRAAGPVC